MWHTGDTENSKSVREGKLQSIVWINTVTYGGGAPSVYSGGKTYICGRENSITRSEGYAWGQLDRTYFPVFPSRLRAQKSGSVTVGNEEEYLKTEFKSGGRKSGGGSSATLIIFCRFLKYMCICLKAWTWGKTKSKCWVYIWSVSTAHITGVYLGGSTSTTKGRAPFIRTCLTLNECTLSFPVKWSWNGWGNFGKLHILSAGL